MLLNTTSNPKFLQLLRMLDLEMPACVGHLELFWHFASQQADGGDVGKWSDEAIEAACYWKGQPGKLVASLVACGLVDRCARHRLVVHDWAEHAPSFIKRKVKRGSIDFVIVEPIVDHDQPRSDHDQPLADQPSVMSSREEKSREEKPREEKSKASRTPKRKAETPCPDELEPEACQRIIVWAREKLPRTVSRDLLSFAWESFRGWAHGDDKRKRDWEQAFRTALLKGWVFEGFNQTDPTLSPAQAKAERTKQAARDAVASMNRRSNVAQIGMGHD